MGSFEEFLRKTLEIWENETVLFIDDVDILCKPSRIYSSRLGNQESFGFFKTSAEPTYAVKAFVDYACANGKSVVVSSKEEHFLRFMQTPLRVVLPKYSADDYKFFLQAFLGA